MLKDISDEQLRSLLKLSNPINNTRSNHVSSEVDLTTNFSLGQDIRKHRLIIYFAGFGSTYILYNLLLLAGWSVLGSNVISGQLSLGWLWLLLLFAIFPVRQISVWFIQLFFINCGVLLKRRLMQGALRLKPEQVRRKGVGQLLGHVLESESIESLAQQGGVNLLIGLVDILLALPILAIGAGSGLHAFLLIGILVFGVWLSAGYFRLRRQWLEARLNISHDLIEQMVGYRTVMVQGRRERYNPENLANYAELSRRLDNRAAFLNSILKRSWLGLAVLGLTPALISGNYTSLSLTTALGGILYAYYPLTYLPQSLLDVAGAIMSAEKVTPLFKASLVEKANNSTPQPESKLGSTLQALQADAPFELEVDALTFKHPTAQARLAVQNCSFTIRSSDKILLEGSSGSGKSSLAALLAGLQKAGSGRILLNGKPLTGDIGNGHDFVVLAPQFHENYIFNESLAFNLLLGRNWPPQPADIEAAEEICEELGLQELLEKMPGGIWQLVGETGWQLSQGERSRIFIARALLQEASLIILDESFAALDPLTLQRTFESVRRRSSALVVVHHA
jgi:ATP-binding cassette, subfamily B, bacterial